MTFSKETLDNYIDRSDRALWFDSEATIGIIPKYVKKNHIKNKKRLSAYGE